MKRKRTRLYHQNAIDLISQMQIPLEGVLQKNNSPFDAIKIEMKPRRKGFGISFKFDGDRSVERKLITGKFYKNISLHTHGFTLALHDIYLRSQSPPRYGGDISAFHTKGYSFKSKYYYRLIIPLNEEIRFHYQIEEKFFESDLGYVSRTGTEATIDSDAILVNIVSDKNKQYFLSIESKQKQAFESFSNKAFAITNGLGYITGHFAGDNGYFFAYSTPEMKDFKHFHFSEFRSSIQSGYDPIYSNPYSYLDRKNKAADRFYKKGLLRPLRKDEFSALCQKLHDSPDFTAVILLILESMTSSLLIMPGGLAIALETLSDVIIGDDKIKLAPIKDTVLRDLVRKKCSSVIKEECVSLPTDDIRVLLTRIELINQPTNRARLTAPFEKLQIALLPEDIKILNTRNDFLHGRVPKLTQTALDRRSEETNKDLYYASIRFYVLLNILILKWIGYDNYVVNYPKIHEGHFKIRLKESPFRKV